MNKSIRHLIQCQCILNQFKSRSSINFHQFSVFSIIDENDDVKVKYAQCNNCGIIHRVFEIGKSEIIKNKEHMNSIVTIDDLQTSFDQKLVSILQKHGIEDVSIWEEIKFIIDNESWGSFIVLSKEKQDSEMNIKLLKILGKNLFIVDSEIRNELI